MVASSEVSRFLADFKAKLAVYEVIYLNGEKNLLALADLDIRPFERTACLKSLAVDHYYRSPQPNQIDISDLWEFGVFMKGKEVHIKIQMGALNRPTICISFHIADYPMTYPYKSI